MDLNVVLVFLMICIIFAAIVSIVLLAARKPQEKPQPQVPSTPTVLSTEPPTISSIAEQAYAAKIAGSSDLAAYYGWKLKAAIAESVPLDLALEVEKLSASNAAARARLHPTDTPSTGS